MTFINHIADAPKFPRAEARRNVLSQLLFAYLERTEQRRQRIALDKLDNRLREDIGLPPRPVDAVLQLTKFSKAFY